MSNRYPPRLLVLMFFNNACDTPAKTEQLLRPEVTPDGPLASGDFDKAIEFFPGEQRNWPTRYGAIASAVCLGAASIRLMRHPLPFRARWFPSVLLIVGSGTFGQLSGSAWGSYKQVTAHAEFIRSLEDREGFGTAIGRTISRSGGVLLKSRLGKLRLGMADLDLTTESKEIKLGGVVGETARDYTRIMRIAFNGDEADGNLNRSPAAVGQRGTEAILENQSSPSVQSGLDAELANEQAKFDAMLEAERRGVHDDELHLDR